MAKKEKNVSEILSEFCELMDRVPKEYDSNYDEVHTLDYLTQDYLHKLELEDLDYQERAKIATQLSKVRKRRRACKNMVSVLEPLSEFLSGPKGRDLSNMCHQILGETRKIESQMADRMYFPRVLNEPAIHVNAKEV